MHSGDLDYAKPSDATHFLTITPTPVSTWHGISPAATVAAVIRGHLPMFSWVPYYATIYVISCTAAPDRLLNGANAGRPWMVSLWKSISAHSPLPHLLLLQAGIQGIRGQRFLRRRVDIGRELEAAWAPHDAGGVRPAGGGKGRA